MRLVQLRGNGNNEVFKFSEGTTDQQIAEWYNTWSWEETPDDFQHWMNKQHDQVYCEAIEVESVFV